MTKTSGAEPAPSTPASAKPPDIASATVPDALATLHVNPDTGLTRAEVAARRKEHGYNEVAETKGHPVLTSSSIAKADTTNLPVTTNAMATNAAFRMVRLILLMSVAMVAEALLLLWIGWSPMFHVSGFSTVARDPWPARSSQSRS